jgi:hypothetical protein
MREKTRNCVTMASYAPSQSAHDTCECVEGVYARTLAARKKTHAKVRCRKYAAANLQQHCNGAATAACRATTHEFLVFTSSA